MSSTSVHTGDGSERQTPVKDEATPEQPVVQRAGIPLTDLTTTLRTATPTR